MRTALREDGFTLTELLFSTAITLLVLAVAMGTFQNALTLNETATMIADSNQNLRAGTNALVRDLDAGGARRSDRRHLDSVRSRRDGHQSAEPADNGLSVQQRDRVHAPGDHHRRRPRSDDRR